MEITYPIISLIKKILFRPKDYLIVNIEEKTFNITHAIKRKTQLFCLNTASHPLTNNEIRDGVFFKPSFLCNLIKNYASAQNLTKPQIICFYPSLKNANNQHAALLQVALCLSKSGFFIKRIIPNHIQYPCKTILSWHEICKAENVLDRFLSPHYHFPLQHPLQIGASLCCLCIYIFFSYFSSSHLLILLKNKNAALNTSLKEIKNMVKTVHTQNEENKKLWKKVNSIFKYQDEKHTPLKTLSTISETIPAHCAISMYYMSKSKKINTDDKSYLPNTPKKLKNRIRLNLERVSLKPQEVAEFVKALSKNFPYTHFSLENIKKIKLPEIHTPDYSSIFYAFSIHGAFFGTNCIKEVL